MKLTKPSKVAPAAASPSLLSLPTDLNEPPSELSAYSILLYGAKKIGKTSLAARFPKAIFLATEPGTKALRVYTVPITKWEDFIGYLALLEKTKKHEFKNVVVDTVDILYKQCFNYVCRKHCIKHPSDENDFGKTWTEISETFEQGIYRLLNIDGMGKMLLSHDTEKEYEDREGNKLDRVQPTMDKGAMKIVEAAVDMIINYHYKKGKRYCRIDGAEDVVAGCRIEEHFLRQGGKPRTAGDRIVSIACGDTAQEAYDNILSAFNNKQKEVDPSTPVKAKAKFSL